MKPLKKKSHMSHPELTFQPGEEVPLLAFLRVQMPGKPAGTVKSYLEHGQICVNGTPRTQYNLIVRPGDTVSVQTKAQIRPVCDKRIPILFEDDEWIVVNKPAGMLTVSTETEKEKTVYHLLMNYVRQSGRDRRIFIVHRLDRDTSGIVLFAKNEQLRDKLQERWEELVLARGYYALVEGTPEPPDARLESWLKENTQHKVYVSPRPGDGKKAITQYALIKNNDRYALLDVQLETGRKNQIRVQLSSIGHPVVGDKKYGGKSSPLKRLGLHAYRFSFRHPLTGEVCEFEAKPPHSFWNFTDHEADAQERRT